MADGAWTYPPFVPDKRSETSRVWRFWCWLWYGHDQEVPSKTVAQCQRCGAYIFGDD